MLIIFCLGTPMCAQLVNGSFEQGAEGWVDPCQHAVFLSGGALGCGATHASVPLFFSGSECDPSWAGVIWQRIPWIQDGEEVEVSFWYKGVCDQTEGQSGVALNVLLGLVNGDGGIHSTGGPGGELAGYVGTTAWHHWSSVFTYQLGPGDTAAIAMGGFGANEQGGLIHFDDVQVMPGQSMVLMDETPTGARVYYDMQDHGVVVLQRDAHRRGAHCLDAAGREVLLPVSEQGDRAFFSTGQLAPGAYLFTLGTARGTEVLRFVEW